MPIFDLPHPKNHWSNFYLSWICTSFQKVCLLHLSILEIQSILEFCYQSGHTHFLAMPTQNVFDQVLFKWNCINMRTIRLFHWFVLDIWLIKKCCNLIGWEHFSPYLRNKNFPKNGICAGEQQIIYTFIIDQIQ